MSMAELQFQFRERPIVVIMGVSGCGKSTVATALAARVGLTFLDADDFHPKANVDKMSQGIPLTDEDRYPWLTLLGNTMRAEADRSGGVIAACSALKKGYRQHLSEVVDVPLLYVLLDGSREILLERMQGRQDHYMPPSLLDSQLATLERPGSDEPAITVPTELSVNTIIDTIEQSCARLSKPSGS